MMLKKKKKLGGGDLIVQQINKHFSRIHYGNLPRDRPHLSLLWPSHTELALRWNLGRAARMDQCCEDVGARKDDVCMPVVRCTLQFIAIPGLTV